MNTKVLGKDVAQCVELALNKCWRKKYIYIVFEVSQTKWLKVKHQHQFSSDCLNTCFVKDAPLTFPHKQEHLSGTALCFQRTLTSTNLICCIITTWRLNESLKKTSSEKSNSNSKILQKSGLCLLKDCVFIVYLLCIYWPRCVSAEADRRSALHSNRFRSLRADSVGGKCHTRKV